MTLLPSLLTMTDNEIVTCTLENPSAFSEIVARYEAKLMRYIRRLGVIVAEDQEDLLQEIFIKVYKNANAFDTSLSFSSWIYRIAHNETISFYRRLRVRPEGHQIADSEEILGWLAAESVSAEGLFAANTNAEVITKALATLEPKYREPLVLRYFEHKEYDEISDILQIPVGSVGTLIHRGKKRLQTQMKSDYISI